MEVSRIELYDFKIVLTEREFSEIRDISDWLKCSIENAFIATYLRGLLAMIAEFDKKG